MQANSLRSAFALTKGLSINYFNLRRVVLVLYVTFHGQQECVYDFPSLSLDICVSADVSELVFKQERRSLVT